MARRESPSPLPGPVLSMHCEAGNGIREALRTRDRLTPLLERLSADDARFRERYRRTMLLSIVDRAIQAVHANMGNIQLFDPASQTLRIDAQRGFSRPFLDFFDEVREAQAACGTALQNRRQVVVEDVADSAIFLGAPSLPVLLDAGVRSVQSTPLLESSGRVLGVLSVHGRWPRAWSREDGLALEVLARNAAAWIEQRGRLLDVPLPLY